MILDTKFKQIKGLMNLKERFLYYNKVNNGYTILLDNQNVVLRTQVKFKDIITYYKNQHGLKFEEDMLDYFERTFFLNRENTIRLMDEDAMVENKFNLKKVILNVDQYNGNLIKIVNGKIIEIDSDREIGEVITESLF